MIPEANFHILVNPDEDVSTTEKANGEKKGSTAVPQVISWKNKGTQPRTKPCALEVKQSTLS